MKNEMYQMVNLWRECAFTNNDLKDITKKYAILERQVLCLDEEVEELMSASRINNQIEMIDGYCDVIWVACMLSSILNYNPISEVQKLLKREPNPNVTHFEKLQRSIRKLKEYLPEVFKENKVALSAFENQIVAIIYRGYQGLQYQMAFHKENDLDVWADYCFSQVIFSNYSKFVNGGLPKDSTGKVTKSVAKANGTYIEPDFSRIMK